MMTKRSLVAFDNAHDIMQYSNNAKHMAQIRNFIRIEEEFTYQRKEIKICEKPKIKLNGEQVPFHSKIMKKGLLFNSQEIMKKSESMLT